MLAAVIEAPRRMEIRDVPIPQLRPDEILVKVKACGVCGTDVHIYNGEFIGSYPIIPGHEFCGVVEAMGSEASRITGARPGDPVACDPSVFCEACYFCRQNKQNHCENWQGIGTTRNGGFAEYVAVPARNVCSLKNLNFEEGAFVEPLACVVYGQERARLSLGDSVLIFGAGPIGLLHLQLAAKGGASRVTVVDLKADRLKLAESLGATYAVPGDDPDLDARLKGISPYGFDLVIDATGVPRVIENAIKYVKNSGRLLIFGVCPPEGRISISPFEIYRRDIQIIGSFAIRKTFLAALDLLENHVVNVKPLIGGRFTLEEFPEALDIMRRGEAGMKLLVEA